MEARPACTRAPGMSLEAFLTTPSDPKEEWGMFHMLVSQMVLQRPTRLHSLSREQDVSGTCNL